MAARILIVEDEQLVAADLEAKLHRLGYKVVGCAASGPEALQMAANEHPDLVLMDIRLQGDMDGIQVAKRLQTISPVKVIFVSAFAQLSKLNGGNLPLETCLTKPYSKSQLEAVLASILNKNSHSPLSS